MMRRPYSLAPLFALAFATACGADPATESKTPAPMPPATTQAAAAPAPAETARPAEPTPEEKKRAEALKELDKDRAKMMADHEAEVARWTPELRAEAKALADKTFPSGKAAVQAAAASKTRNAANAQRDKYRHPAETMEFFGLKPSMTVLEYGPGDGWYTELLAPALAKKGKLLATNGDPNGLAEERSTFYAQRFKLLLDRSPELYGKVETVTIDGKAPKLGHEGAVDMAIVMRGLHGMVNAGKLDEWLAAIHASLKPNGVLGIEEHRAKADADALESSKKGYLPEKWVIEKITAAGFKLVGKSELNANPKDTKDYADGVWTLPPTLKNGDKDREKYVAIGESDRMTLKFTKVAPKAAAAAAKPAPAAPAPAATPAPLKPAAPPKK